MSLINKMLQDLDARAGQPGAAPLPSDIRPVAPTERSLPWKRVAVVGGVAVALVAAGLAGWRLLGQKPAPAQVAAPAAAAVPVKPAEVAPVIALEIPVPPRQDAAASAAPVEAPMAAEPAPAEEAPRAVAKADKPAAPKLAKAVQPAERKPVPKAVKAAAPAPAAKGGRDETPAQRAENAYRRALASLDDGRVTEAIAGLQGALKVDPRHEPSRQTLVSLLIEAKRPDEALRQLGAALALDARQPAMAMLMARLQMERGSPGIDTLLRTLPYAAGNGEYHGFLAGALQREGRHREAAEHYGVALRTAPHNGVWWMGLGISLQSEKRNPEAAGAFQKALDSGTLTPELQGFVERKLKQLVR
ncbi:tetratricopeptide repeat protein [Massilia sp. LjRoot122]|uniref:tetratricopeptide repeat protein n=1 Tax=Massilia sp. LjRoot122 TaxID=3342257 RepID=UPI003ECF3A77